MLLASQHNTTWWKQNIWFWQLLLLQLLQALRQQQLWPRRAKQLTLYNDCIVSCCWSDCVECTAGVWDGVTERDISDDQRPIGCHGQATITANTTTTQQPTGNYRTPVINHQQSGLVPWGKDGCMKRVDGIVWRCCYIKTQTLGQEGSQKKIQRGLTFRGALALKLVIFSWSSRLLQP